MKMIKNFLATAKRVCDNAVTKKELLSRLHTVKLDICIADPLSLCGELVAELINIPLIYCLQFSYEKVIERLCAGLLILPSYIPDVTSRLTDSMTFIQRLEKWLLYTMREVISAHYSFPEWNEYYSKFLGKRNLHAIMILISYV